ncbi:Nn.00g108680.m01.CDS01 [Neocucurbitaria sp. VM-36]
MPSQPPDPGWDFSSVIDLIDSDVHDITSPTLRPTTLTRPSISTLQQEGGVRLGSFAKLYENLGLSNVEPAPALPPLDLESELSNSDEALLPSPILEPLQAPLSNVDNAEGQPSITTGMSKKQRQKARKQAEKERREQTAKEQEQEQEQRAKLRKQLQDLANASTGTKTATIATPKPARSQSGSNVGAKIKPACSAPVPVLEKFVIAPTAQKEPKTPKKSTRPALNKRASTARPDEPVSVTQAFDSTNVVQAVQADQPASAQPQNTTFGTPAPFQLTFAPPYLNQLQPSQVTTPAGHGGLVPRTVQPLTLPRPPQNTVNMQPPTTPTPMVYPPPVYATPMGQPPAITIRSQVDRHFHLFNKLLSYFPDDRRWLVSPMQLVNEKTAAHGLHVFVDASNIMFGFKDTLRNHGIIHPYDMSFDSLALLMERRRPVAKRVFAGSHREANPLPHVTKLVETSRAVGYESNVKEQVLIVREESEKKKFFNDVKKVGWYKAQQMRSGSGSDSETGPAPAPKTPSAPKWVEQGVDEILHLKMCQSIIDVEIPSTMVLATGDGAEAEMSDGFLAQVERALKKGWKVELISWRQQTNGGYRNKKFRTKWADSFRIIELDDFLEDLIDMP